jgi:hypothetical protein
MPIPSLLELALDYKRQEDRNKLETISQLGYLLTMTQAKSSQFSPELVMEALARFIKYVTPALPS